MKKLGSYLGINLLVIGLLLTAGFPAYSQQYLEKPIRLHLLTIKLGQALDSLAFQANFYFSYSSGILPSDSLVSLRHFNGTIREALQHLLGDNYDFQETDKHVIIRPTPFRLNLIPEEVGEKRKQYIIRGYVLDEKNNKGIPRASVYEKHFLSGTLTDKKGYFKLKIKSQENVPLMLTVSKELYKDTTTVFLPAIYLGEQQSNSAKYGFLAGEDAASDSFFGRLLLGPKQKINALNIGNFFTYAPVQVSIWPGLSSQGIMSGQIVNKASYNLLGGYTAGVDGIEWAGVFNINRGQVRYVQAAGFFNIAGGSLTGIQLSGVFNAILDNVNGIQAAGVFNKVKKSVRGIQLAGIANSTSDLKGLQVSLLNKTQYNKGLQLGIINIADSTSGVSIGLLNLIGDGFTRLSVFGNETTLLNASFKTGTGAFYSLAEAGLGSWNGDERYTFGFGIGHEFNPKRKNSYWALELSSQQLLNDKKNRDFWFKANILYNRNLSDKVKLFVAPSLNVLGFNTKRITGPLQSFPFDQYPYLLKKERTRCWAGLGFGLSFF